MSENPIIVNDDALVLVNDENRVIGAVNARYWTQMSTLEKRAYVAGYLAARTRRYDAESPKIPRAFPPSKLVKAAHRG